MRRGLIQTCVVLGAFAGVAGCGSKSGSPRAGSSVSGVDTVRAWSQALTRGDVAGASALFALPSLAQIDPTGAVGRITRPADARTLDESLPCGARLLDARMRGRYIDALFLLTRRPGASCDGPGGTARVAFRISAGKIAEWRRLADEPGDSSRGTAPQRQPGPQPQQTVPGQPAPTNPTAVPPPQARSV